jgi:hypothetical protein
MKSQFTEWKQGSKRNFRFSSIMCIFFLEKVPVLGPRVEIILCGPHDPAMARWTALLRRQRGGRVPTPYNHDFFLWWRQHVIALDDYPYTRIDFRGYLEIPLPPGSAYGDIGMSKFFKYFIFLYFCIGK